MAHHNTSGDWNYFGNGVSDGFHLARSGLAASWRRTSACSVGKYPRAPTPHRHRALRDSKLSGQAAAVWVALAFEAALSMPFGNWSVSPLQERTVVGSLALGFAVGCSDLKHVPREFEYSLHWGLLWCLRGPVG